jgi:hypothetical protein
LRAHVARINRRAGADIQPVPQQSAEDEVGNGLGHINLAEEIAARTIAVDAVLLRITPADTEPEVAIGIGAYPIGGYFFDEHLAVANLAARDIDVKHTDMLEFAVDDVELLLVMPKGQPVRLFEVVGDNGDGAVLSVYAINVVARLLLLGLEALVVSQDPVTGIGEPDSAVGGDDDIVGEFNRLPP